MIRYALTRLARPFILDNDGEWVRFEDVRALLAAADEVTVFLNYDVPTLAPELRDKIEALRRAMNLEKQ